MNVDHNILKPMLKYAMKRDLLTRRDRVLEPDEWARLYAGAPSWFKPVLLPGYHIGMRLEKIVGHSSVKMFLGYCKINAEKARQCDEPV